MFTTGKYLFNDSQLGENQGGYEINGDTLKLRKELFKDSDGNQKTLVINAVGFENVYIKFTPNKSEVTDEILWEVPSFVKLSDENTYLLNTKVSMTLESMFGGKFL